MEKVEDCFDGGHVWEFRLEKRVSESMIEKLGETGHLDYYRDFPRPFFRVYLPEGLIIMGVEGEDSFRVIFPGELKDSEKAFMGKLIDEM